MAILSNRGFFYVRIPVINTTFPSTSSIKLPFQATRIIIAVRNMASQEIITFSLQTPNIDGEIFSDDTPLAMDGLSEGRIWLRTTQTTNPKAEVRIWAWRGGGG